MTGRILFIVQLLSFLLINSCDMIYMDNPFATNVAVWGDNGRFSTNATDPNGLDFNTVRYGGQELLMKLQILQDSVFAELKRISRFPKGLYSGIVKREKEDSAWGGV